MPLLGVWEVFDTNHDGSVDYRELVAGISSSCMADPSERLKWAFQVFDIDGDGYLDARETSGMFGALEGKTRGRVATLRLFTHRNTLTCSF